MFFNQCVFQVKEALDYLSFLPPKSAEGFLKAIQVQCRVLFFQCSYYYQECEKLTGTLFGNANASCAMLHYPVNISDHCLSCTKHVKVFLFTASVKDQFISTWFTYSCVTKGNVLKVTVKLLSLQLYHFISVNEMYYSEFHNLLVRVCSLWGIEKGVTVMTLSRYRLCKIFTGKLMHVRLL